MRMKATRIQKWWRYKLFRQSIRKYIEAAQLIQATFKAHLIRRVYKTVQHSVKVIQKVVKKHLAKKFYVSKLWKGTRESLDSL